MINDLLTSKSSNAGCCTTSRLIGRAPQAFPGLAAFTAAFRPRRTVIVGGDGIPLGEFLSRPVSDWLQP